MTALKAEALELIQQLPEENISQVVAFIKNMDIIIDREDENSGKNVSKRIGIAEGKHLYADDYDIDKEDEEVLGLFEVL